MKRVTSLVAALLLLASMTAGLARASDYISSYNITVANMGGGVMRVTATIGATHPNMTRVGFPTICLYEWDGSKWVDKRLVSAKYASNAGGHVYSFDYSGTVGNMYYAYSSFLAEDNKGGDSRTGSSASVQARP